MKTFKTTRCTQHGHREVTLQFSDDLVMPNGERLLLSYFEDAVSAGTHFSVGQTIGLGGNVLRLIARADGTLGLEEPVPSPDEEWVEQVDRSVREVMLQRYVCDSVDLPLTFTPLRGSCLVTECSENAAVLVMKRIEPKAEWGAHVSGWVLACGEEHDHGEASMLPLLALSAVKPFTVQFLALPPDTAVVLTEPGRALVLHGDEERAPLPGSYLEQLNAK